MRYAYPASRRSLGMSNSLSPETQFISSLDIHFSGNPFLHHRISSRNPRISIHVATPLGIWKSLPCKPSPLLPLLPSQWLILLEWVSEWVKSFSHVWLFATPWTVAYQAPPSMGFSRQEYWSGLSLASRLISMEPNFHILQENQNAHFRFPGGETEHTWPTTAWEHNNEISYWTDNMYGVSTMCQACAKQFTHVIFITTSHVSNKYLLST